MQLHFIVNLGGNSDIDLMNNILDQLGKSLNINHSEDIVAKLVKIFYYIFKHKENEKLIYKAYENVIRMLYNLGCSEQICKLLNTYAPQEKSDLLRLLSYSARISCCDSHVKSEMDDVTIKENLFLYQGCQLLRIKYYRTFGQINLAFKVWSDLKNNTPRNSLYYPLILSYANVSSFNIIRRVNYLRLAEKEFFINGDYRQACAALLNINANLYHQYVYNVICKKRFLQEAYSNFDKVRSMLPSIYYHFNEVQNNKMILELVDGKTPLEEIKDGFCQAKTMCGMAGNRAVINSNIVGVSLKLKNVAGLDIRVRDIMKRSREHIELNCEFGKYALLNCYNYFHMVGDKAGMKEAVYFFRKGATIGSGSEYLFSIPLLTEGLFRFRKFHLMNVMNWDINFENLQSQS